MQNTALRNAGTHGQCACTVAGQGVPQQRPILVLNGKRKLQCVVKNMFIIGDAQIMLINLIGRLSVQFIQDGALRFCDFERIPQRFPSADIRILHMNVRSANEGHQNTGGSEICPFFEQESLELIVAESSAAPDRNIPRHFFLNDPADIPDRNRIDGGDHLNRFQVPDLLQRLAKGIPERGKLIPLHRKQAGLRKAVRSFKKHAGDYKLFIGYSAIIDTAGR